MTGKTWAIFAAIVAVLIGGLVYLSKDGRVSVDDVNPFVIQKASAQNGNIGDHVFGKADSKVVIYEYGDFQCGGCAQTAPILKEVSEKYKDKIAFVYRHFPIPGHANARAAAATAEAAGLQGKFWQMHDVIYANQSAWDSLGASERTDVFVSYAKNLGLKEDQFKADLISENVGRKIDFDYALGKKSKVSGTPTIFINDKLADEFVKDGKIVPKNTEGAKPAYSDPETFYKFLLEPAMKEAGIPTDK